MIWPRLSRFLFCFFYFFYLLAISLLPVSGFTLRTENRAAQDAEDEEPLEVGHGREQSRSPEQLPQATDHAERGSEYFECSIPVNLIGY